MSCYIATELQIKGIMPEKKVLEEGTVLLLQFDKRGGLLPVIVQEHQSGTILMLGYANREALQASLETKTATFWSTSRQALWTKGETSGDFLRIKEVLVDCDQDALVYQVEMAGAGVCHTKNRQGKARRSCFYRKVDFHTKAIETIQEFK
jgi:phosphoribosyl-AMP cyclohydrolase